MHAHDEPRLADMLADPIIRALMERDRVAHRDIEQMLRKLSEASEERPAR